MHTFEPISPAASDVDEISGGGKDIGNGKASPLHSRCDYVKVIVSSGKTENGPMEQMAVDRPTAEKEDRCTLQIERIITDSYLQKAWRKCQFIDLFLYSVAEASCSPNLRPLIPAHRILLSAYSDFVRQFIQSYPEPVKFVEQLQGFLQENENANEKTNELNLKALGLSSIPVLVLSVPLADLHDLVHLMYYGEVSVERCRINSLQKSAHMLKVSFIFVVS